ncbi:MAG: class I SAM-dependent methyltransferase [Chloroflexaceae bacterium]|nr:class I SAM-dependent methyltransferase [Chloroflexaceae bacterium]NJO06326.1 class I SAM-dependent methyltransferase [Chloroflexaceae bacterium]
MRVPPLLEPVACPLCGATAASDVLRGPDRLHGVPGRFRLVRCHTCTLIYQNPRPTADAFDLIYPEDYKPHQAEAWADITIHPDIIQACHFVAQHLPNGGKLIDVGCGAGHFLVAIQQQYPHWHVIGIDPSPGAGAFAHSYGIPVQQASLETASLEAGVWNAVTLWNVFEHVPNPLGTLQLVRTMLVPDGMLFLGVPMADSWDAKLFGKYWVGWDLPRHFFLPDHNTLGRMLNEAGFEIVATECHTATLYCFTESIRWLINDRIQSYALRRLSSALTFSRPLRWAIAPYLHFITSRKRATILSIAARRLHHKY